MSSTKSSDRYLKFLFNWVIRFGMLGLIKFYLEKVIFYIFFSMEDLFSRIMEC